MKLSDLRKVTVKKHLRIRFPLSNGMECVVNEHGIAQVPALHAIPSFNLEAELTGAQSFIVEPVAIGSQTVKARTYTRDEVAALAASAAGGAAPHDDHDE